MDLAEERSETFSFVQQGLYVVFAQHNGFNPNKNANDCIFVLQWIVFWVLYSQRESKNRP